MFGKLFNQLPSGNFLVLIGVFLLENMSPLLKVKIESSVDSARKEIFVIFSRGFTQRRKITFDLIENTRVDGINAVCPTGEAKRVRLKSLLKTFSGILKKALKEIAFLGKPFVNSLIGEIDSPKFPKTLEREKLPELKLRGKSSQNPEKYRRPQTKS